MPPLNGKISPFPVIIYQGIKKGFKLPESESEVEILHFLGFHIAVGHADIDLGKTVLKSIDIGVAFGLGKMQHLRLFKPL